MHRYTGIRGLFTYCKGWLAYHVWMLLPLSIAPMWLLPSAGDYAYWDDARRAYGLDN